MEIAHFIFGIFGNATALFLFLSPIITFRRVIRKKSTEDFSGVPYGLPFVSPNNMLVWTINGTGALIEAIYVLIFLIYAPKKVKARMFGLLALVSSLFAAVALISVLALHDNTRKLFCGSAATIFSICMYASPLSIMRLVIKTKSVEFMPFFLSLFVFLCGTSWFIYGLLGHDPFIIIPNGCGSALGAVQLILYVIYRNNKGEIPAATASKGEAIEMGGVKPSQANVYSNEKKKQNERSANEQV
ncbi:hypothetical protein IEQ34_001786 [Dendrobium chrysotoxum]|uniref:Bidirectional sugar transporter SWEET n=1 Tax=Dendrobium chrysotoxum TaxID=161865 RepID=A0AAV7HRK7_DENCH|nr:hypothetical protein IEQ34_001786 [Dendrobium chrysotoxum]